MTFYVEQCTERTIFGGKWQHIPGTDHDDLDEVYCTLMALRDTTENLLRIGRTR